MRSRCKEPSRNKAEAYRVYGEHLFRRSDAADALRFAKAGTRYYHIPDNAQGAQAPHSAIPADRTKGVRTYLYLNGERVAVNNLYNTNHGQYYYGSDILGSVRFVTGQAGQELKRIEYDAFGGIYKGNSPYGLETGYTGKPYDAVTGLSDYGFRDYSPTHARFITEDPIRDGENWFAYVGNNPVNWVDPWGLSASDGQKNGLTRDQILDTIQAALNMAGLIPGVGEVADVANSFISLARGNYEDAAFSVVSMVPTIGDAIGKGGKAARFIEKSSGKKTPGGSGQKLVPKKNTSTDFIVDPSGQVFPMPKNASGPYPVTNNTGKITGAYFKGSKGGDNGQVRIMRIMDPTPPRGASPGYPNGYIKYENMVGQGVDPYTGKTLPNSRSHFPLGE